jgi:hypothetical protein
MDYEHLVLASELSGTMPMKYGGEPSGGGYSQPMSLKYAELCSVPKSSQYPEVFTTPGQYDALFPVDTPNIIPNLGPAADFKQQAELENKQHDTSQNQFADSDELDLFSLLALPPLANNPPHMYNCDPFMFGVQPSCEETDFSISMPDDIHYWNGFQKDSSSNDGPKQAVADSAGMTYGLPKNEEDVFHTSSTLESALLLENGSEVMSPVNSELSLMSDESAVPSNSPATSEKWDKGLRDLFERTFDLSDIEGDYMFPPPNKRQDGQYWAKPPDKYWSSERKPQHWAPERKPQLNQQWAPEKKPELSSPNQHWGPEREPERSPPNQHWVPESEVQRPPPLPVKPFAASPSPPLEAMSTSPSPPQKQGLKQGKNKPKPTLLFGKHEGEIIQKLLVANDSIKSKPITRDKLITIPVEEFNQLLEDAQLSEIEVAFMKEWRRRGKNKAAAQVARKRKREEVSGLDEEVEKMRQQKVELEKKYDQLGSLIKSLKERSAVAEDRLFKKQSENLMEPVSRKTHLIHVTDDDKLLLIPKISSKILVVNS